MKYGRLKTVGFVVVIILSTWSCDTYLTQFDHLKNVSTEMEFNPSLAGSLAYGSFSIQDLLERLNDTTGLMSQTEDSLIYLFYADTAFSLDASGLLEIPDHLGSETYISSDINIPEWLAIDPGTEYNFHRVEKLDFAISPEDRIDSVFLKAGSINLTAFSEFKHGGTLSITSSNVISPNGDTLFLEIPITETDGSFSTNEVYDLNGYTLLMEEEDNTAYVKIHINLKLVKEAAGISVDEEAGINLSFEGIDYSAVFGFIAPREITDLEQSIDIGFFQNLVNTPSIYFADPNFKVSVNNSLGVPLTLDLNTFRSRSATSGEYIDLTFKNDTMMPFIIYAPSLNQIGQFRTTSRDFNVQTSNIDEILSNIPDKIDFSFSASTGNPPASTEQNFILDTSRISLDVEVYMPLHLSISGYTLSQPMDIDVAELVANVEFIERATFTLTTINEWPIDLSIQVYFQDDQGTIIDSLFQGVTPLLTGAPVTSTGELDRALLKENPFVVELTQEKLEGLGNATMMMIKATAGTTKNPDGSTPSVKFFSNYMLNYKLSIDAKFNINTAEL